MDTLRLRLSRARAALAELSPGQFDTLRSLGSPYLLAETTAHGEYTAEQEEALDKELQGCQEYRIGNFVTLQTEEEHERLEREKREVKNERCNL